MWIRGKIDFMPMLKRVLTHVALKLGGATIGGLALCWLGPLGIGIGAAIGNFVGQYFSD